MFVQKFLARQPIFNSQQAVYGYELLYRSGPDNSFRRRAARPRLRLHSSIARCSSASTG